MPGSYGAEKLQGGRYRLSFTVGGLLSSQGKVLAGFFLQNYPGSVSLSPREKSAEVGRRIANINSAASSENILALRTETANKRTVQETSKRLSALTLRELTYLADGDTPATDCWMLMWVAMCRCYALVGEFARTVLRDHYLLGQRTVSYEDFDNFMLKQAMWHPEVEELSTTTVKKLRANLFKAMSDADLINSEANSINSTLLSSKVMDILKERPSSFEFFPMRVPPDTEIPRKDR